MPKLLLEETDSVKKLLPFFKHVFGSFLCFRLDIFLLTLDIFDNMARAIAADMSHTSTRPLRMALGEICPTNNKQY